MNEKHVILTFTKSKLENAIIYGGQYKNKNYLAIQIIFLYD